MTEYGGALYFTKGSGSNGIDTVYTVSSLPTVANAAVDDDQHRARLSDRFGQGDRRRLHAVRRVLRQPHDDVRHRRRQRATRLDVASHAGLEKWSLVDGVWQLDYVLTEGLIGVVDSNLNGPDGPYPDVTTVGLRNLTGVVHGNRVTLWATTSTSSASGDNGADPNKVVEITDDIGATTLTGRGGAGVVPRRRRTDLRDGLPRRGVRRVGGGARTKSRTQVRPRVSGRVTVCAVARSASDGAPAPGQKGPSARAANRSAFLRSQRHCSSRFAGEVR